MHPARRRLAGQPGGELFDRLQAAQVALARGADGLGKPLNCTATTLAKIAELRPDSLDALERDRRHGPAEGRALRRGLPRDPARRSLISVTRRGASPLPRRSFAAMRMAARNPRDRPMNSSDPQLLVSTDWLAAHLSAPDLRILDASWHMPAAGRDARAEFEAAHIPGARFFDIDEIADDAVEPAAHGAAGGEVRRADARDGHRRRPPGRRLRQRSACSAPPRVWWTFRLFGKTDVAVLDGGLPKWRAEGRPLEDGQPMLRDRHFTARRDAGLVRDVTQVAATAKLGDAQIVDARAAERFRGEAPEPRPGLRSGHIPGAKNVPLRQPGQPRRHDEGRRRAPRRSSRRPASTSASRSITTCGSGVSAAILSLALERLGNR